MNALEAFVLELNALSAEVILPLFRTENGLRDKGGAGAFDPVTQADREAERVIRQAIERRFPTHGVIGEELGEDRADAEFVWVLDPIDGTRAFIAGLPVWTTLIGLRWQGSPVLGSIGQPCLGEVFLGSPTGARLVRGSEARPLRVRACAGLFTATVATTDTGVFAPHERAAWARLRAAARLVRMGCDAYAYAMVAAGTVDLVVEASLKSWDIEAAVPVLTGAGGHVTDWRGSPVGRSGGQVAIAGDPRCLAEALALLAPAASSPPGANFEVDLSHDGRGLAPT
ncbi:MAG: histidinol-phosphatase [Phenylobacterium zucineum]|nr:MAG: histidinol-phosphatase [Phenylobacterium zucineum]